MGYVFLKGSMGTDYVVIQPFGVTGEILDVGGKSNFRYNYVSRVVGGGEQKKHLCQSSDFTLS